MLVLIQRIPSSSYKVFSFLITFNATGHSHTSLDEPFWLAKALSAAWLPDLMRICLFSRAILLVLVRITQYLIPLIKTLKSTFQVHSNNLPYYSDAIGSLWLIYEPCLLVLYGTVVFTYSVSSSMKLSSGWFRKYCWYMLSTLNNCHMSCLNVPVRQSSVARMHLFWPYCITKWISGKSVSTSTAVCVARIALIVLGQARLSSACELQFRSKMETIIKCQEHLN